jgi:hypothetical protein
MTQTNVHALRENARKQEDHYPLLASRLAASAPLSDGMRSERFNNAARKLKTRGTILGAYA